MELAYRRRDDALPGARFGRITYGHDRVALDGVPRRAGRNELIELEETGVQKGPGYGILGGTFDPPHVGHLVLAQEAYVRLRLDRVWFMPAADPPHKAGHAISPWENRRAMVETAIAGDARFALTTIEHDRPGPSYTVDTLRILRDTWGPAARIALILGWDMLAYLPHWHDPTGVLASVDQVAAAHRPGFPRAEGDVERLVAALPGLREKLIVLPGPEIELAATTLRERVASGLPIRYLVSDGVRAYIARHHLYADPCAPMMDAPPDGEPEVRPSGERP